MRKFRFQTMRNTHPFFIHVKRQNIKDYDKIYFHFLFVFEASYDTFKKILDKYPRIDNVQKYCNRMLSFHCVHTSKMNKTLLPFSWLFQL